MKIHNKFEFELIDKDGNIKYTAKAYNIVLNSFWTSSTSGFTSAFLCYQMAIGTGTGTISPTRTSLFNQLSSAHDTTQVSRNQSLPISSLTVRSTFPATAAYVGNITEVGLINRHGASSFALFTHALLVDAEGNPTSIPKSETDILNVTATVFMTVNLTGEYNWVKTTGNNVFLSSFTRNGIPTLTNVSIMYSKKAGTDFSFPVCTSNFGGINRTTRQLQTGSVTSTSESTNNNGFANFHLIGSPQELYTKLPNPNIVPQFEIGRHHITNLPAYEVGRGDGATIEFIPPIPTWVLNTEEIRVSGTLQVRGTHYTVDSNGNTMGHRSAAVSDIEYESLTGGTITDDVKPILAPAAALTTTGTVWDFGKNITCNGVFCNGIYTSSGTASITGLKLQYSNDNLSWMDAYVFITPLNATTILSSVIPNKKANFTQAQARYWRLIATGRTGTPLLQNLLFGIFGQGIVFNTPPPQDALITFCCTVNRPWKDNKHIIKMTSGILNY